MRAVAAYMASKTLDERKNGYGEESRPYQDRPYQSGNRPARSGMDEEWPEGGVEMRRRRDSNGRYMTDAGGTNKRAPRETGDSMETGYRERPTENRGSLYDGGGMGFGSGSREYQAMNHSGESQRKSAQVGGTMWMQPVEHSGHEPMSKETLEKWVRHMRDDKGEPIKAWSAEEIKPLAMRFGYPTAGDDFENFYAAIHMMKSDYCAVAEDFDVNTPAFYAALADAWLKDPDAAVEGREKLEAYYKHIAKGEK